MSENDSDFVTILSSELIATIVEAYFNDVMYKVPVHIVDLKPTSDGYAFSLTFVTERDADVVRNEQKSVQKVTNEVMIPTMKGLYGNGVALEMCKRDEKGRFVSIKQDKEHENG